MAIKNIILKINKPTMKWTTEVSSKVLENVKNMEDDLIEK